ncbi:FAD-binding oxidoreductase [Verminephrobacter aporrectodeae subsp. tuberculatae]|uniref:FAD-dependent oxidoreductase n=1 Tax=Verminephrobacter aporrectodeae TaxID=1110389 RepID=UPI0022378384|nr:FAD-dependent oxidoreductase [Verminephrobacter aporrectodeae]MCW5257236.1 FAD-binding oxidoreductase [Verminephrobacter aporrectodeae subsp. tuberculatae]
MMHATGKFDAAIIGGGFYGSTIAIYLARQRGFKRVILIEKEPQLLARASYHNQARVHNGYHYPRSFTTAFRSRVNLPRFVQDWSPAIKRDFTKLYAIARRNSKVTAKQFERFCQEIGAKTIRANNEFRGLFSPQLIEEIFLVEEYAFDARLLAQWAERALCENNVRVLLKTSATSINRSAGGGVNLALHDGSGKEEFIDCQYVFNCTYSGLNQLHGDYPGTQTGLKHEITEIALVKVPAEIENMGVTVMDGPFFSMMPFPARGLHTLSHVRYTPHLSWEDKQGLDPYAQLASHDRSTRSDRMIRDVARYIPIVKNSRYVDSLFEVKTVLQKNEGDDGRPILFEKYHELPGCYSILGGKIDNIYDVLEKLEAEDFSLTQDAP